MDVFFIFFSDRRWKANKINALYQWYCKENHLGDSSFGCLLNSCQFMKPSHATTLVWKMAGTLLMSFLLGTLNILLTDLPSIKIIFSEECLWSLLFFRATEVVMMAWKILIDRPQNSDSKTWLLQCRCSAVPVDELSGQLRAGHYVGWLQAHRWWIQIYIFDINKWSSCIRTADLSKCVWSLNPHSFSHHGESSTKKLLRPHTFV